MITFYDNAFSPFARKVWLALELEGLPYTTVDGLLLANREALAAVNGRVEVPAIVHDGLVVVGSADIVAYLERISPAPALHPADTAAWVHARAWERCADTAIDPVLINLSYWTWAERDDRMPDGMLAAAQRDLDAVYAALERDLEGRAFVSGDAISIADVALFPHLTATKAFGVGYDVARFPRVHAWLKRLRAHPGVRARPRAGEGFPRRVRLRRRPRAQEDLLARRPHRVGARERVPSLVRPRDRERPGALARVRGAGPTRLTFTPPRGPVGAAGP